MISIFSNCVAVPMHFWPSPQILVLKCNMRVVACVLVGLPGCTRDDEDGCSSTG